MTAETTARLNRVRALAALPPRVAHYSAALGSKLIDGSIWTPDGRLMVPPAAHNAAIWRRQREVTR